MPKYVLDTNLYIRATRDEEWNQALESFLLASTPWIHLHSVVAMELLAGAINPGLERQVQRCFLDPLERRGRLVTPSHGAWKRAATGLTELLQTRRVSRNGITRSLINDLLIAASARDHGFFLVTESVRDFRVIQSVLPLEFVRPWPDVPAV